MKTLFTLVLLCALAISARAAAPTNQPVTFNTSDLHISGPTNIWRSNVLGGASITLTFDALGRVTIAATGVLTNMVNGFTNGIAGTLSLIGPTNNGDVRLKGFRPGFGLSGTNEGAAPGTNISFAIDPTVVALQTDITTDRALTVTLSNNLVQLANWPGYGIGWFGGATNLYYSLGYQLIGSPWAGTGVVLTNGVYRCTPWFSGGGGTLTNFSLMIRTATGNFHYGIYESTSARDFYPSNLVYDAGNQAAVAKIFSAEPNVVIKPQRVYWTVVQADGAMAVAAPSSLTGLQGFLGYTALTNLTGSIANSLPAIGFDWAGNAYGNLPSPFPLSTATTNVILQNTTLYQVIAGGAFK
jgi:hypothetical protein